jgi:hypothetical protein
MFREKAIVVAPKKEDVAINTILPITTHSQIPKNVVFKEKKPFKNKSLADCKKKIIQHLFEEAIKDIQQKEPPRDLPTASIQTQVKANLTKNYSSDTKNHFLDLLNLPNLPILSILLDLLNLLGLLVLFDLPMLPDFLILLNLFEILVLLKLPKAFKFWRIALSKY